MGSHDSGFSLPASRDGLSSLVENPPWFFGGQVLEVAFRTDREALAAQVPAPLRPSASGLAAVAFVDMTSVNSADMAYERPDRSQFCECLFKLHCEFEGRPGWYVPATWVNKDFSLLRGFILGFGKKLANICMTRFCASNVMIGDVRAGARSRALCEAMGQVRIDAGLRLRERVAEDCFANNAMYLVRHFPAMRGGRAVHELVELEARDGARSDFWHGDGSLEIQASPYDEVTRLQPRSIVGARLFKESFTLLGARVLHDYTSSAK